MIRKGIPDWGDGLSAACKGGHIEIAQWMTWCMDQNLDSHFKIACEEGDLNKAKLLFSIRTCDLANAMIVACHGGKCNIVKWLFRITEHVNLMVNKLGLTHACEGGNMEIIMMFINAGVCDWNNGWCMQRQQYRYRKTHDQNE